MLRALIIAAVLMAAAPASAGAWLLPRAEVGKLERDLPAAPWTLSMTMQLRPNSVVVLSGIGNALRFRRAAGRELTLEVGGRRTRLTPRRGWPQDGRHRIELAGAPASALAVDGRRLDVPELHGGRLAIAAPRGAAVLEAVIAEPADGSARVLAHRLASLRLRTPPGRFPLGSEDAGDRIHYVRDWTAGFWPGALWQASTLAPEGGLFARWALDATLANLGREHADTHDLGFIYGRSSVRAWQRRCAATAVTRLCARLRSSGLKAADRLLALAATNRAAGMIPTRSGGSEADVIIDSVMNTGLLAWATQATGDRRFATLAADHARRVANLLVRPDGSTAQSVHVRRSDGAVLAVHTHQGFADGSTWARGQAWAIYGYADLGLQLSDRDLIAVGERAAAYVEARMPAGGLPPYDYDAPPPAPVDLSAAAITAAGLLRLDAACRAQPLACAQPRRWRPLALRVLAATLRRARVQPPLGRLGAQVYSLGGRFRWEDHAELVFGLDFALEAANAADMPLNARGLSAARWEVGTDGTGFAR